MNTVQATLSIQSTRLVRRLLHENPRLSAIYGSSRNEAEASAGIRRWAESVIADNDHAQKYYTRQATGPKAYARLRWNDLAAIRVLDYLDHSGREFQNPFETGQKIVNHPFHLVWASVKTGQAKVKPLFLEDMIQLFRQLTGRLDWSRPDRETVQRWMARWRYGLEPDVQAERGANKERIINILVDSIESCEADEHRYTFEPGMTRREKIAKVREWWADYQFHLRYAVRSPALINTLLDHSLDSRTQRLLEKAQEKGIPFFVNPYYLSLLSTRAQTVSDGSDLAIRHYVLYSKPLVDHFGNIKAWEKEDKVKPGKPNAAGWLLPSARNLHRRYPEVAILIPDTMGRACGGLCVSCQRMYDFQRGNLSFRFEDLKPGPGWREKLQRLMAYFEHDTQLRDILITGGDALMSQDESLEEMLSAVCEMADRKRAANRKRPDGKKFAEIIRIRLGTRLLAYLPQRITPRLQRILAGFRERALPVGLKQFVIQTHFQSPMEVTPEARLAVTRLLSAGWMVVNQLVFTSAASRRGHTARLRQILNDIGVITYYTFGVKGFLENTFNYATNARAVQEQEEEKWVGRVPERCWDGINALPDATAILADRLRDLRREAALPFLSTDRNVINLPGVGKSMTFRTIGITGRGRRILEFDHDHHRWHSPIIDQLGKIVIIESKPIGEYLRQLKAMGEDVAEYESVWGYSIGETEPRLPLFEYPPYSFRTTREISNLSLVQ